MQPNTGSQKVVVDSVVVRAVIAIVVVIVANAEYKMMSTLRCSGS